MKYELCTDENVRKRETYDTKYQDKNTMYM